jgi:hypothetical protein
MAKQHDVCYYDIEVFNNFFLLIAKTMHDGQYHIFRIFDLVAFQANEIEQLIQFFSNKKRFFVGYNNRNFDDQLVGFIVKNRKKFNTMEISDINKALKKAASSIIDPNKRWYRIPTSFRSIDLMKVIQVGKATKSLKQVAINLRWPLILEMPISPHAPVELAHGPDLMKYCKNDVNITEHLYKAIRRDINLRAKASVAYGVNLLSASNSMMSSKILDHTYAKASGQKPWEFRDKRSPREWIGMEDIVAEQIEFKTKPMQEFLDGLLLDNIWAGNVNHFAGPNTTQVWKKEIRIGNTDYLLAKGGLHSANHQPTVYMSSNGYSLIDIDADSYYPRTMLNQKIKPGHLDPVFLTAFETMVNDRLDAKKRGDMVKSESLKITINSVFGKCNYDGYWLYDPLALYRVTINGQLFLLMLIERLEMEGIPVIYANTDGIIARVHKRQQERFEKICNLWMAETNYTLSFSGYDLFALRDVNNYLGVMSNGKVKGKGDMDKDNLTNPTVILGLMKGYNAPVVPLAIHNYFVHGIDIRQTIEDHEDILDFCKGQKVGNTFQQVYIEKLNEEGLVMAREPIQKINRYFACKRSHGGILSKVKADGFRTQMVKGTNVYILNDLRAYEKEGLGTSIVDKQFYIKEAEKVVGLFRTKQLELL